MKKLSNIPISAKLIFISVSVLMCVLCLMNYETWSNRMDYSFGYLTPIFVAYIIFDRKEKILEFFSRKDVDKKDNKFSKIIWNAFFGIMMFCAVSVITLFILAFAFTGQKGGTFFGTSFGIVWFCLASFYMMAKTNEGSSLKEQLKFTSLFIFPCFIWLVSTPLFGAGEELISIKLLSIVANITYNIMDSLGFVVTLRGNALEFPNGSVGVAEACSGIRSLTACIFAGSFLAAAMLDKTWKKIALVITSMFFAFLFNLVRALFLSFWAYENGPDSISGTVHDAAGYFVLGMTVIGLLILVSIFNINPIPEEFRKKEENSEKSE